MMVGDEKNDAPALYEVCVCVCVCVYVCLFECGAKRVVSLCVCVCVHLLSPRGHTRTHARARTQQLFFRIPARPTPRKSSN